MAKSREDEDEPTTIQDSPAPTVGAGEPEIPVASEVVGPYHVVKELGRGGMGVVYLADDSRLGRRVALKVLDAKFAHGGDLLRRFRREAATAARVDHPGICTVYEAGEEDGQAYIAMRYVDGETLAQWITRRRKKGGTPTRAEMDEVVRTTEAVARAMHVAHEAGLVHRDIKPANIILAKDGQPVILDFGLVRTEDSEEFPTMTQTGAVLGTPSYMSPEQIRGDRKAIDRRSDVYSLGVTLYECLTLQLPYAAPTLAGLLEKILTAPPAPSSVSNPAIPHDLALVIDTAIEKDPTRRYATAADFAEDLRRYRAHEPIRARPTPTTARLRLWYERNPVVALSLAGTFVVLVVALVVALGLLADARASRRQADEAREHAEDAQHRTEAALAKADAARVEADAARKQATDALDETRKARDDAQTQRDAAEESRKHAETERGRAEEARGVAESERSRAEAALTRVRALGLLAASWNEATVDPVTSLRLALEASLADRRDEIESRLRGAVRASQERAFLRGHEKRVVSVAFSPKGELVATASEDGTARVWDFAGHEVAVLRGHRGPVRTVAFSPDGAMVVTASDDGTAAVWEAADGLRTVELAGHGGPVVCAEFSPSGTTVLTGSADGTARLWDLSSESTAVLQGSEGPVSVARFSASGDRILTAASGRNAHLWDAAGKEVAVLAGDEARITTAAFSATGEVVTGYADGTVRLWDAAGQQTGANRVHAGAVTAAAFYRQSENVITVGEDGALKLLNRAGKVISSRSAHRDAVACAAVAPTDLYAVTASRLSSTLGS